MFGILTCHGDGHAPFGYRALDYSRPIRVFVPQARLFSTMPPSKLHLWPSEARWPLSEVPRSVLELDVGFQNSDA
jgi:hypothetical protein